MAKYSWQREPPSRFSQYASYKLSRDGKEVAAVNPWDNGSGWYWYLLGHPTEIYNSLAAGVTFDDQKAAKAAAKKRTAELYGDA